MNSNVKIVLTFITLFAVGFASGYLFRDSLNPPTETIENSYRQSSPPWNMEPRGSSEPNFDRAQASLSRWMDLDEEQREAFFRSLNQFRRDVREIMTTGREQQQSLILKEYEQFRANMEHLLSEEQLTRLDARLHPDSVRTGREEAQQRRGRGRQ